MSTDITSLKLKILGLGAAAVIGATMLLGATNSATAATAFTCPNGDTPLCYNELGTRGDASGDFRGNAAWQTRFVPGGGFDGSWSDFDFLTTGLLKSQFAEQAAFGSQDPTTIEGVLESSDWFDTELTFVDEYSWPDGTDEKSAEFGVEGNVVYIHVGGFGFAFLYDAIPTDDFFVDYVGKGLSNYRIYNSMSAVPIPAALPLFGAALLGLVFLSRRRKIKAKQA